jgi:two-component system, NarL family, sensor histidine kinase DesK
VATVELHETVFEGESVPTLFRIARLMNWIWLALLVFPLDELLDAKVSSLHLALALTGLAVFVTAFATLLLTHGRPLSKELMSGLVATMFCVAVAMTAADRADWASMFIYPAGVASMWMLLPRRVALAFVLACVVSAVVLVASWDLGLGSIISTATTGGGVCILMLCFGELRSRNFELLSARGEIARLAVSEERLRFARDLHDLLGHSLSVIALKAELAGRMLELDVQEAATHVHDVERVARTALAEVREAASGYRRPVLANELDGARMALEAAGIETSVDRCEARLSPHVEALLAWTVREGTTNVIRHSGARNCRVAIKPGLADASVEVLDDGPGTRASAGANAGHGLDGLRERTARLGGELEAGPAPGGGFCLRVSVPIASSGGAPPGTAPPGTAPAAGRIEAAA